MQRNRRIIIARFFPGVQALKGVDLDIHRGEVHAIIGENGAGKSTLMKVLTGVYQRDAGEYWFEGEKVNFTNVQQSIAMGISCIYQEKVVSTTGSFMKTRMKF